MLERLERQPVLALLDCYTKGTTESQTSPLYTDYMRSDFNALQVWSPDGEDLVSQVLYIPQGSTYVCQLAIQPHHREHVFQLFPKYFQERMLQTLRFLQAYVSASRRNTTTVRFHYSQTQDVSNVTPSQAVPFFSYDICPLDLGPSLLQTLRAPSNLLTSYSGLQPMIQQAMEDHSIDPENYGKGAKGKAREGSPDHPRKKVKASIILLLKALERVMVLPNPPGGNPKKLQLLGQNPNPKRRRGPPRRQGQTCSKPPPGQFRSCP